MRSTRSPAAARMKTKTARRRSSSAKVKSRRGGARDDCRSSLEQFTLATRAVAARRTGCALRDQALSARQEDHAGAAGIARRASAWKVAGGHRQWEDDRGIRRDRRLKPPPGTDEALRYTYWLHFAEGSAMPPFLIKLIVDRIES